MSLPVDKWLDVGPQIMVLRRDIHQQESLQHQWVSGYWKKAIIFYKGAGANEKRLFPVKEPPGGGDSSRRPYLTIYPLYVDRTWSSLRFFHLEFDKEVISAEVKMPGNSGGFWILRDFGELGFLFFVLDIYRVYSFEIGNWFLRSRSFKACNAPIQIYLHARIFVSLHNLEVFHRAIWILL